MEFKIICTDGELALTGHESTLSGGDLGELFTRKTGTPVSPSGAYTTWWEFNGTVRQAREAIGMPLEDTIPGPMPGPIPIPPKPKPKPIEELTDRELLEQTRRTLRRMERKINYMFEVISDVDERYN